MSSFTGVSSPICKKRLNFIGAINAAVLLMFGIAALYPFWNVYIYSFNDGLDSLKAPLYFFPRKLSLDNILIAFFEKGIYTAFKISVLKTVIGTATSVFCTASLAYAMTKRRLPGYKLISYYFFITFLFGGGLIPYFLLLREMGLYNTFWVYILPGLYGYWNMVIMRSFFDTIPTSIEESAQIDGAGYLLIFMKLIIPLSKPVFAAIALFNAISHWNDWFMGEFFVKSSSLIPVQTLLQRIMMRSDMTKIIKESGSMLSQMFQGVTPYSVRMAIVVIVVTPIIIVYPFLQKYFIKGIMIGAVKG